MPATVTHVRLKARLDQRARNAEGMRWPADFTHKHGCPCHDQLTCPRIALRNLGLAILVSGLLLVAVAAVMP